MAWVPISKYMFLLHGVEWHTEDRKGKICITEVVRVGKNVHLWSKWAVKTASSPYCVMLYFWWGYRGNLKLTTLGSQKASATLELRHLLVSLICIQVITVGFRFTSRRYDHAVNNHNIFSLKKRHTPFIHRASVFQFSHSVVTPFAGFCTQDLIFRRLRFTTHLY